MGQLSDALEILRAEKKHARERSEAIATVREVISRPHFAQKSGRKEWEEILHGIAGALKTERNLLLKAKASTQSAVARLKDVASLYRLAVERSVSVIQKKAAKNVMGVIFSQGVLGHEVYVPLASETFKILATLVAHQAHLDALDDGTWLDIIKLCFGAVFNKRLHLADDSLDVVGQLSEGEASDADETTGGRSKQQVVGNLSDLTDVFTVLAILFTSANAAALIIPNASQYLSRLLRIYKRLRRRSSGTADTSAHLPLLQALNALLAQIGANAYDCLIKYGPLFWDEVLALWSTKIAAIKEQILVALTRLAPVVLTPAQCNSATVSRVNALWDKVFTERVKDRFKVEEIAMAAIALYQDRPPGASNAFMSTDLYPCPSSFTCAQAMSWLLYDLSAQTLHCLYTLSGQMSPLSSTFDSPGPSKRRKTEDPLTQLFDALTLNMNDTQATVHTLQILHFFISAYWKVVEQSLQQSLQEKLVALLSHSEPDIVTWSFLGLGVIAQSANNDTHPPSARASPQKSSSALGKQRVTIWDQAWSFAIRRMSQRATCRGASYCAAQIMKRALVLEGQQALPLADVLRITEDVKMVFRELTVHGPSFLFDSACDFLATCLKFSRFNADLHREKLSDKLCDFLTLPKIWPATAKRSKAHNRVEMLHLPSLFRLLACMTGIELMQAAYALEDNVNFPLCDSVWVAEEMRESQRLRKFAYAGEPLCKKPQFTEAGWLNSNTAQAGNVNEIQGSQADPTSQIAPTSLNRITAILENRIAQYHVFGADEGVSNDRTFAAGFSGLLVSVAAVLVAASCRDSAPSSIFSRAAQHLRSTILYISASRPSASQVDCLLGLLRPIFVLMDPIHTSEAASEGILRPKTALLVASTGPSPERIRLLQAIWASDDMFALLDFAGVLSGATQSILFGQILQIEHILQDDDSLTPAQQPRASQQPRSTQMDIDSDESDSEFGSINRSDGQLNIRGTAATVASSADDSPSPCKRMRRIENYRAHLACAALLTIPFLRKCRNEASDPVAECFSTLFEACDKFGHATCLDVIQCLTSSINSGLMVPSLQLLETVLQRIGNDVLPTYRYSRNQHVIIVLCEFLGATTDVWASENAEASPACGYARALCTYLTDLQMKHKITSWRSRLAFIALMDRFVASDASETMWGKDDDEHPHREDGSSIAPSLLLPVLTVDKDFRVCFCACVSAARLLETFDSHQKKVSELYKDMAAQLITYTQSRESILTRLLLLANIMVASPGIRRAPFATIILMSIEHRDITRHISSALQSVVLRIGLENLQQLHNYCIAFIAERCLEQGKDLLQVPDAVCGFESKKSRFDACFRELGANYLVRNAASSFYKLRQVVNRDMRSAFAACLPLYAAQSFLQAAAVSPSAQRLEESAIKAHLDSSLQAIYAKWKEVQADDDKANESINAMLKGEVAQIVASTVGDLYIDVWRPDGELHTAIAWTLAASRNTDKIVRAYTLMVEPYSVKTFSPQRRTAHPISVLLTLKWLNERIPFFDQEPHIFYGVCQKLLCQIHTTPFPQEQERLLLSLILIMALCCAHLFDPAIQRLLLHGLACLHDAPEAAAMAWGPLSYMLRLHPASKNAGGIQQLTGIITHLKQAAYLQSLSTSTAIHASAVYRMEQIDMYLQRLYLTSTEARVQSIAHQVLALQPILGTSTESATDDETFDDITRIFRDCKKFSGRFNIVKRLAYCLGKQPCDFSDTHLPWELLEAMEPADVSPRNGRAMADILNAASGRVTQPKRKARRKSAPNLDLVHHCKELIIGVLANLLTTYDLALVNLAFDALERIFAGKEYQDFGKGISPVEDISKDIAMISDLASSPSFVDQSAIVAKTDRTTLNDLEGPAWIESGAHFESWITDFALFLIRVCTQCDQFFASLKEVCQKQADCAKALLPMLAFFLVLDKDHAGAVTLGAYFKALISRAQTDKRVVETVIDIVSFMRQFQKEGLPLSIGGDFWLPLSWLLVARGALATGNATTSLMSLELAHEHENFDISSGLQDGANHHESLVLDILEALPEPDSFYGIRSKDTFGGLIRKYRHEESSASAFELSGALYESFELQPRPRLFGPSTAGPRQDAVGSLVSFGLRHMGVRLLQSSAVPAAFKDSSAALDLAWRTENWDLPMYSRNQSDANTSIFNALRSLHQSTSSERAKVHISRAYSSALGQLCEVSASKPNARASALKDLAVTREIELWVEAGNDDAARLASFSSEKFSYISKSVPYETCDAILAVRACLARSVRKREEATQFSDLPTSDCRKAIELEQACHFGLSLVSRRAGRLQIALNEITMAHSSLAILNGAMDEQAYTNLQGTIYEELANVLWERNEHSVAMDLVRSLLMPVNDEQTQSAIQSTHQSASLLARLGAWTYEARLENAKETAMKYFEPAARMVANHAEFVEVQRKYFQLADSQLAAFDAQHMVMAKLEVDTAKRRQQVHQLELRAKNTADRNGETSESYADSSYALDQDETKLKVYKTDRLHFLRLTMKLLIAILANSDEDDDSVFRFVSLWFQHASDEALNAEIAADLDNVPSSKFVFLAPQLTSRMAKVGMTSAIFRSAIARLVERLCVEHPYHLLYQILALKAGGANLPLAVEGKKPRKSAPLHESQTSRALAAETILAKLRKNNSILKRVDAFQQAFNAFNEWAAFDLKEWEPYSSQGKQARNGKTFAIPPHLKILQLRDLPIPISTFAVPIDRSCQYDDRGFPTISHYNASFRTAGGINLPKITNCLSNNKMAHKQVFKGGDDTRQDAVMEQVFGLVNTLLAKSEETAKRSLHVRTYAVIPLGPKTGLLEFVANSRPLSEIMNETLAAIRPKDWTYSQCRKHVGNTPHTDVDGRVQKVQACFQNNQPVFRHFFFSAHKQAADWFDMRLNYTRSVAVNSMVGYVLGIGDRHVSNLLLDTSEGDLVPIDFGITFDAGLRLGQPELVPFRLTRNIVDAFGMTGVEGVYRRCCEESLRVLRDRASVILTILEVFKYDPLQKWDISESKYRRVQNSQKTAASNAPTAATRAQRGLTPSAPFLEYADNTDEDVPPMALQALAGVTEKLKNNLSVEYNVNDLIQQAQDIRRLAIIFPGWQPVRALPIFGPHQDASSEWRNSGCKHKNREEALHGVHKFIVNLYTLAFKSYI